MNTESATCNCWTDTNEALKPEGLKLQNLSALRTSETGITAALYLPLQTLDGKKPPRSKPAHIWMDYCPFCGRSLSKAESQPNPSPK